MEGVNIIVSVIVNDFVRDDERTSLVRSSKAIHGETSTVSISFIPREKKLMGTYHPGRQVTLPKSDSNALAR